MGVRGEDLEGGGERGGSGDWPGDDDGFGPHVYGESSGIRECWEEKEE